MLVSLQARALQARAAGKDGQENVQGLIVSSLRSQRRALLLRRTCLEDDVV